MHPIERLRYVARSSGADQRVLVRETAEAIRALGVDAAGLVVACRRIVERHPTSGPLWWLCASLLAAPDAFATARSLAREVEADPTSDRLVTALGDDTTICTIAWPDLVAEAIGRRGDTRALVVDLDGQGSGLVRRLEREAIDAEVVDPAGASAAVLASDVVVVEAFACSDSVAVVPAGGRALASVAHCSGIPVWLVAGRGRRLPAPMIDAMVGRLDAGQHGWRPPAEPMPIELVSATVGPGGQAPASDATRALAPECPFTPELVRAAPI